jgi:microcompartment protein CcmL/EutN
MSEIIRECIGMIEYSSIAKGIESADAMLKAAAVELVMNRTICSGKYIVMVTGDVSAVTSSVQDGERVAAEAVIDSFIIPNVHPDIFPALTATNVVRNLDAMGVLESFGVASLIEGADAAVKAANVELLEIRLAMALGGKAFVTLTGEISAVRSAVDAGADVISQQGLLVNKIVIPRPSPEIVREII